LNFSAFLHVRGLGPQQVVLSRGFFSSLLKITACMAAGEAAGFKHDFGAARLQR
jgi:hypothetical protein